MAQTVPTDVSAGVRTRWAAATSLNAIIPSTAVYLGRVGENVAYPYARLKVSLARQELNSGSAMVQWWRVDVEAFTAAQPAVAGTLAKALLAALCGTSTDPTGGLTVTDATVLHVVQQPGTTVRQSFERKDGRDVVVTSASFEIMLQTTR